MKKIKKLSGLGLSVLAALVSSSAMASQKDQTPVSKPTNVNEILVSNTLSKIKAARDGKKSEAIIDSHKRTLLSTLVSIGQPVPSGQDAEGFALNYLKELSTKSLKTTDPRENTATNTKILFKKNDESDSKVGMVGDSRDDISTFMRVVFPGGTSHPKVTSTTSNEVKKPFGGSDVRNSESSNVRKTEISNVRKSFESSDSDNGSAQISQINSEIKIENSKVLEAKEHLTQIIHALEESGKQLKTENTSLKAELEQFKKLSKENHELNAKIEKMSILARQKDEKITILDTAIGAKEKQIVELTKDVENKDQIIYNKQLAIKELGDELAESKKEFDEDFIKLGLAKDKEIELISKELKDVSEDFANMIKAVNGYQFENDVKDVNGNFVKQVRGAIEIGNGGVKINWEE